MDEHLAFLTVYRLKIKQEINMASASKTTSTTSFHVPPSSYEDWLRSAGAALKGGAVSDLDHVDEDGLSHPALFTSRHRHAAESIGGMSDELSSHGARRWVIAQYLEPETDPVALNRAILDELTGGTERLIFTADQDPAVILAALDGVHGGAISFAFDDPSEPSDAMHTLMNIWTDQDIAAGQARGHLGIDMVAAVLAGRCGATEAAAKAEFWIKEMMPKVMDWPRLGVFTLGGGCLHRFGLTPAQELSVQLAHMAALMRMAESTGHDLDGIAAAVEIEVAMDADLYGSIAKARAARVLMDRFYGCLGLPTDRLNGGQFHGVTSDRMLSCIDQDTNMLRSGTAMLAMALSGLGVMTALPHDWLVGSTAISRRIARNSHHVLADEAHLAHVADPAQGSYFIDSATSALAEKAWQLFQQIESQGGIFKALEQNTLAAWASAAALARQTRTNQGRDALLGVTLHPLRGHPVRGHPLQGGGAGGCIMGKSGLRGGVRRPSAPWEELRGQFQQMMPRCLLLDVYPAASHNGGEPLAQASRWLNAAGIDGTKISANPATASASIVQAQPDILVFDGQSVGDDIPDGTVLVDAAVFASAGSTAKNADMLAVLNEIYTELKAKIQAGENL
jgi:hypothetical protein